MDKRLAGAILAVAAVLGLTACSSGTAASSFVPAAPASTTVSATPSSTPTAVAGLRSFSFPSDIQVEFQTSLPASEPQRSAMIAYENYVDSMWYAVYTLGSNKVYTTYISGNALTFAKQILGEFKAGHYALRGTVVYSDISVPNVYSGSGAVVESCVNISGLHMVDPSTGQSAGNILNSKYTNSQEQAAAGKKKSGTWWIVHTDFYSAASGGTAGMCA
jgi:hypothetical protein